MANIGCSAVGARPTRKKVVADDSIALSRYTRFCHIVPNFPSVLSSFILGNIFEFYTQYKNIIKIVVPGQG